VLAEKQTVLRQEFVEHQRDLPEISRKVVDAYSGYRLIARKDGFRAKQSLSLRSLHVQFYEGDALVWEHVVQRLPSDPLPPRRLNPGSLPPIAREAQFLGMRV